MKTHFKIILKSASLAIILISIVYGLYAQHKYENLLVVNSTTAKNKTQLKTSDNSTIKLAKLYKPEIKEETRKLEKWMFLTKTYVTEKEQNIQIENWMLDKNFWEIEKGTDQEPVEQDRDVEDWMKNFDFNLCGSPDIYSDFKEKEWMKKHSFYIL